MVNNGRVSLHGPAHNFLRKESLHEIQIVSTEVKLFITSYFNYFVHEIKFFRVIVFPNIRILLNVN